MFVLKNSPELLPNQDKLKETQEYAQHADDERVKLIDELELLSGRIDELEASNKEMKQEKVRIERARGR